MRRPGGFPVSRDSRILLRRTRSIHAQPRARTPIWRWPGGSWPPLPWWTATTTSPGPSGAQSAPGDVAAYDLRSRTPGHTDLERLRQGMVGAQFWSVYVPPRAVEEGAARVQLEQIDIARQMIARTRITWSWP
jgi:hypothetical protein